MTKRSFFCLISILPTLIIVTDLRRQARHLENEIDAKLVSFSKLGVSKSSSHANSDSVPLLDEEHVFENMASEIDCLLTKVCLKTVLNYK